MDKALELWKRLFEWTGTDPSEIDWISGDKICFFCGMVKDKQPHASDCIWIEAKKLVEENKE